MKVLNLIRLFWGCVSPYISRIHTAYIGFRTSILGTNKMFGDSSLFPLPFQTSIQLRCWGCLGVFSPSKSRTTNISSNKKSRQPRLSLWLWPPGSVFFIHGIHVWYTFTIHLSQMYVNMPWNGMDLHRNMCNTYYTNFEIWSKEV